MTYDYLHVLNFAPPTYCVLCGLNWENMEHLFVNCPKSYHLWSQLSDHLGSNIEFNVGVLNGDWLTNHGSKDYVFISYVIAVLL